MGRILKETKDYKIAKLTNEFKGVCIGLKLNHDKVILNDEELEEFIGYLVEARTNLHRRRNK